MVYPSIHGIEPHEDMPEEAKKLFTEAQGVVGNPHELPAHCYVCALSTSSITSAEKGKIFTTESKV